MNYIESLSHHGIKGQEWGERNGPPYPLNYSAHSPAEKKLNKRLSKYTNVDGSLNEAGKAHKSKWVERQQSKNNKYYSKYEEKYKKKAENAKTEEERQAYLNKAASATADKNRVNENLANAPIEQIVLHDIQKEERIKKIIAKSALTGVAIAGTAGAGIGIANGVMAAKSALAAGSAIVPTVVSKMNHEGIIDTAMKISNSEVGKTAEALVEGAIRTYADVHAYAFGIYADEVLSNVDPNIAKKAGNTAGAFLGAAANSYAQSSAPGTTAAVNTYAVIGEELIKRYGLG